MWQRKIYKSVKKKKKKRVKPFLKNIAYFFKNYFISELKSLVGVSSFRHLIISILASVKEQYYQQQLAPLLPDWRCSCGRCSARNIRAERRSRSPTSPPGLPIGRRGTPSSIPGKRWNPSRSRQHWNSHSASCRIISCNDCRFRRSVCTVPCHSLKF